MSNPDPAKNRVLALLLLRLGGAVVLGTGVTRWVKGGGEPDPVAAVIMLLGAVLLLVIPMVLIRRWKGPA